MTGDLQLSVKDLHLSVRGATSIFQLPEDVLRKIFLRLPARSLLSCQCVCRHFNAVTRNPNFIATHVKRATTSNANTFCSVFLYGSDEIEDRNDHMLLENSDDSVCFSYVRPSNPVSCNISIVGSCNGLFCAEFETPGNVNGGHFLIWNPVTRENRYVLKPRLNASRNPHTIALAFGFTSKTNDYKVIRIVTCFDLKNPLMKVEVYKMSTDDWRIYDVTTLPCLEPGLVPPCANSPLILSGISSPYFIRSIKQAFHWLADGPGVEDRLSKSVVSFDLEDEELKLFTWLDPFKIPLVELGILDSLNDSLSLIVPHINCPYSSFDIWVMNDYGSQESWTRRLTVEQFDGLARPIGYWNDDLFIMAMGEMHMFFYNLRTEEVKTFPVLMYSAFATFCNYVETFETVSRAVAVAGEDV